MGTKAMPQKSSFSSENPKSESNKCSATLCGGVFFKKRTWDKLRLKDASGTSQVHYKVEKKVCRNHFEGMPFKKKKNGLLQNLGVVHSLSPALLAHTTTPFQAYRRRHAQIFGQHRPEVKGLVPDRVPRGLELGRELLGLVPVAHFQVRVQEAVVVGGGQICAHVHMHPHLWTSVIARGRVSARAEDARTRTEKYQTKLQSNTQTHEACRARKRSLEAICVTHATSLCSLYHEGSLAFQFRHP